MVPNPEELCTLGLLYTIATFPIPPAQTTRVARVKAKKLKKETKSQRKRQSQRWNIRRQDRIGGARKKKRQQREENDVLELGGVKDLFLEKE